MFKIIVTLQSNETCIVDLWIPDEIWSSVTTKKILSYVNGWVKCNLRNVVKWEEA